MKKVYFMNHRKKMLCGFLHESEGKAKKSGKAKALKDDRAVIMLHGFTGDKSEAGLFYKVSAAIAAKGLAVLRFDFSGCGESDDAVINVRDMVEDARSALAYMKAKGYRRFGLLGFSLGGLIALRTKDHTIKARVLLAPLTKSKNVPINYSIWDQLSLLIMGTKKIVRPERVWRKEMVVARRFYFEARSINQRKLCDGIEGPVLVIHGNKDRRVPLDFSKTLMEYLPKGSRLEVIRGADHHFDDDFLALSKLSADWFSRNIKD